MFTIRSRYTNRTDVHLAVGALLLSTWKLISTYREYKEDSQKEVTNATA